MVKICPNGCDSDLFFGEFEFCPDCGAKLVEIKDDLCDCGNKLLKYTRFCPFCGKKHESAVKSMPIDTGGNTLRQASADANNKQCVGCGTINFSNAVECSNCSDVVFRRKIRGYWARVCTKCTIAYHESDDFCSKCGRQLAECMVPRCVHCNGRVMSFCAGCGCNADDAMKKNIAADEKKEKPATDIRRRNCVPVEDKNSAPSTGSMISLPPPGASKEVKKEYLRLACKCPHCGERLFPVDDDTCPRCHMYLPKPESKGPEKCPKCGSEMIRSDGWMKSVCPKCEDLSGGDR